MSFNISLMGIKSPLQRLAILLLLALNGFLAQAHEITPSILNLTQIDPQTYELSLDVNLEALMVEIGSEHADTDDSPSAAQYDGLRALSVDQLHLKAQNFLTELPTRILMRNELQQPLAFSYSLLNIDTPPISDLNLVRDSLIRYQLLIEEPITSISFQWSASFGDSIFRVTQDAEVIAGLWVRAGEQSELVTLGEGAMQQSLFDYLVIGFEHILPLGLDHILFVIGVYLLSQKLSALLWQVSAFTLAHTLTLALATLGWIKVSASIVEPLIAASIIYVAIENLFRHRLSRGRIALVFGFGLLHGLGFAGVLSEIGLNPDAFIPSLIAFNIGVELGQLAVILGMYLLLGLALSKTVYWENWVRRPLSLVIAAIGTFWFIERIFL